MTHVLLLAAAIFAFLVALFALQNSEIVRVGFMGWKFETSLVLVILGSALLGFLTALFLGMIMQIKLRFQLYKARQHIRLMDEKVVVDVVPGKLSAGLDSTGGKLEKALDKTP